MKKNKQPLYKRAFANWRSRSVTVAAISVLGFGGFLAVNFVWAALYNYQQTSNWVSATSISSLILKSIDSIGQLAPVEAKTGDIYFPTAKVYLPRPANPVELAYNTNVSDNAADFSVVDKRQLELRQVKIMNAKNVDDVFRQVPGLQACSRGVVLSYAEQTTALHSPKLEQTITLSDGKKLHAFVEVDCSENAVTARLLKDLRRY